MFIALEFMTCMGWCWFDIPVMIFIWNLSVGKIQQLFQVNLNVFNVLTLELDIDVTVQLDLE